MRLRYNTPVRHGDKNDKEKNDVDNQEMDAVQDMKSEKKFQNDIEKWVGAMRMKKKYNICAVHVI